MGLRVIRGAWKNHHSLRWEPQGWLLRCLERVHVALVLWAGSVFSMLPTSQGVHGVGVEGSGGCVIMPGLQLQCIIYSFIFHSSCYLSISPLSPGPKTGLTGGDCVSVSPVAVDSEIIWVGGLSGNEKGNNGPLLAVSLCVRTRNRSLVPSSSGLRIWGLFPVTLSPAPACLVSPQPPRAMFHSPHHLCGAEMSTTIKV